MGVLLVEWDIPPRQCDYFASPPSQKRHGRKNICSTPVWCRQVLLRRYVLFHWIKAERWRCQVRPLRVCEHVFRRQVSRLHMPGHC